MYNLDWITPLVSAARAVGGWRPIAIHGHAGAHWKRVLKGHGIKSKAGVAVREGIVIMVHKSSVNRARAILSKNGASLA